MGDLTPTQAASFAAAGDFLSELERTPMVKSFKMLTLLAMLDEEPQIHISEELRVAALKPLERMLEMSKGIGIEATKRD